MRDHGTPIFLDIYTTRIKAFELLKAAEAAHAGEGQDFLTLASSLDEASARLADTKIGKVFSAFADLMRVIAYLVYWRRGVLEAVSGADRFKKSALERLELWRDDHSAHSGTASLTMVMQDVGDNLAVGHVGPLCSRLAGIPLPIGILGDVREGLRIGSVPKRSLDQQLVEPLELSVAFVSFMVDGQPADQIHFLTPHETHDLEIEIRVSRWAAATTELRLFPVSIEAAGSYTFPSFIFSRPSGDPPFVIRQRGRATITVAQAIRAQPFEFRYAAEFWPKGSEQPVSVVGHRTLRIESVDSQRSPLTGYPSMDQKLLQIRNALRSLPGMPQGDLETGMTLAVGLAALAGRALQDDLFPKPLREAEFQKFIRDELRRRPEVGGELEEHPHAGGGEVDLSLRGVRLELKVEPQNRLEMADCQAFVEQTAAYIVGSGKRFGLLSVLDASPKNQAPFAAEDGIGILRSKSGLPVLTILIQGGLARPSDLSRRRAKS